MRKALGELGVSAEIEDLQEGPRITRLTLKLGSAEDLERLRKGIDKIPFELGMERAVSLEPAKGERRVALDVPRTDADWRPVEGANIPGWVRNAGGALPVVTGTDVLGEPFVFDLAETPHLFVAGTTGSGKSVCLHALILSLLASGRDVRLALIDPKEVEFPVYAASKRLWNGEVITEINDAVRLVSELNEEMEGRQKELARLGAANISEAQEKGLDLPRIIVVVDELADLLIQNPEVEEGLVRLASKARATGIHLVLATQRPDSVTFTGLLRSNIPSRIALTVRTAAESRIILDRTGAEKLLMRGDMLISLAGNHGLTRVHGARVEQGDIRAWL